MSSTGLFVTLEGVDGCGKTTQATLLVEDFQNKGREVVRLREPGGTRISEKIRLFVLDPQYDEMCDECELLLYEAARAQLVREVVQPALERGAVVVCDRFYDSTFAYQAAARGLPANVVSMANSLGSCGLAPDLTLVFDLDPDEALERATHEATDRVEGEGTEFQRKVRNGYLKLSQDDPNRVHVVDAVGSVEVVHARVRKVLAECLGGSWS